MSEKNFAPRTESSKQPEPTEPQKERTTRFEISPVATEASSKHENQDRGEIIEANNGAVLVVCDGVGSCPNPAGAASVFLKTIKQGLAALGADGVPASQPGSSLYFHDAQTESPISNNATTETSITSNQQYLFFQNIFDRANKKIANTYPKSATTAVVVFLENDPPRANIYWVGDSRVYVCQGEDAIVPVTIDDNLITAFSLNRGKSLIEIQSGIYVDDMSPKPSDNQKTRMRALFPENELFASGKRFDLMTRTVGKYPHHESEAVMPNMIQIPLRPGDRIYVVSDGVYEPISPREMARYNTSAEVVAAAGAKTEDDPRHKDDDRTAIVAKVL